MNSLGSAALCLRLKSSLLYRNLGATNIYLYFPPSYLHFLPSTCFSSSSIKTSFFQSVKSCLFYVFIYFLADNNKDLTVFIKLGGRFGTDPIKVAILMILSLAYHLLVHHNRSIQLGKQNLGATPTPFKT